MLQGSLLGQYNCVMVSQRPRKPFNNTLAAAVTQGVSLHLVILPHSFVGVWQDSPQKLLFEGQGIISATQLFLALSSLLTLCDTGHKRCFCGV